MFIIHSSSIVKQLLTTMHSCSKLSKLPPQACSGGRCIHWSASIPRAASFMRSLLYTALEARVTCPTCVKRTGFAGVTYDWDSLGAGEIIEQMPPSRSKALVQFLACSCSFEVSVCSRQAFAKYTNVREFFFGDAELSLTQLQLICCGSQHAVHRRRRQRQRGLHPLVPVKPSLVLRKAVNVSFLCGCAHGT